MYHRSQDRLQPAVRRPSHRARRHHLPGPRRQSGHSLVHLFFVTVQRCHPHQALSRPTCHFMWTLVCREVAVSAQAWSITKYSTWISSKPLDSPSPDSSAGTWYPPGFGFPEFLLISGRSPATVKNYLSAIKLLFQEWQVLSVVKHLASPAWTLTL